jgi:hypothetical protein
MEGRAKETCLSVLPTRREDPIRVKPLHSLRVLLVTRPLNPAPARQLLVAQPAVVARPSLRRLPPVLERASGVLPVNERVAVLVLESHSGGVVDKDLKVGSGLAGGLDGFVRDVHGSLREGEGRARGRNEVSFVSVKEKRGSRTNVDVGVDSGLFTPHRSRQDDVRELSGLSEEDVYTDRTNEEQI